ncbi:MAG: translation initiation factor [Desulfurococcales archaeon]|nr:translation initiation factor [Desulfurococcales archaeon]
MGKKSKSDIEALCGGLPEELCVQLGAEQQFVKIKVEKRKFGKEVTIIEGLDPTVYNLKKAASALKSRLATGGTVKNNHIELQGDHRHKVKQILVEEFGIPPENIIFIESE